MESNHHFAICQFAFAEEQTDSIKTIAGGQWDTVCRLVARPFRTKDV